MKAESIRDRESLNAWLAELQNGAGEDQDRAQYCTLIGTRAALRVLPLAHGAGNVESTFATQRALLTSGAATTNSTQAIRSAASHSSKKYELLDGAADAVDAGYLKDAAVFAEIAAYAAVNAAASKSIDDSAISVDDIAVANAVIATELNHNAATLTAAFWKAIQQDCLVVEAGGTLERRPLWPDTNPLKSEWRDMRRGLQELGPGWGFWVDWYEKVLAGEPQDWEGLLTDVALIPSEDWDKGPDHVNALIAELQVKRALKATPNAEIVSYNEETRRFRVDPISEMPRDHLEEAVERLSDVLELFDLAGDRSNQHRALEAERVIISQAIEKYAARPRMLHHACTKTLRRLDIKIRNGECPDRENDADIDDFYGTVLAVSVDLFERDPLVREAVTRSASARLREIAPKEAEVVVKAADEVSKVSEGVLAEELPEDARVAVDPSAPDDDRKHATYVTSSRLLRVWLMAGRGYKGLKVTLEEIESLTKTAAGLSENVRKFSMNAAVAYGAAAAMSSSPWLQSAIEIILRLF